MKKVGYLLLFLWSSTIGASVGQRFILTLPETDKASIHTWLQATKPAGVMLLASHFQTKQGVTALTKWLQQEAKSLGIPPLLIATDWEGGIVSRPTEAGGFYSVPSPWSLANSGRSACFVAGMLIGHQLREVGVNVTFAPSLDRFDFNNQILATRCFATDPDKIAECGIAFAMGVMSQGVLPVIKHLPGLGLGKADTHHESVAIAVDEKTFEDQTKPFRLALQAGVPMVMSTHAIVPQFGPMPATLSPQAVAFVKKCNKRAILVTDDLFMKAVQDKRTIDEVVEQAMDAGYHLLIFTAKPDEQVALVKRFDEQEGSEQMATVCAETERFKKQWLSEKQGDYAVVDDKAVSDMLVQRAVRVQGAYHSLAEKAITLLTVNMPVVRTALTNERWFISNGTSYLAQTFAKRGIDVEEHILNPRDKVSIDEVKEVVKAMPHDDEHGVVVVTFFYANENWNTIQRQWLEQLRGFGSALTVISLGHPLERSIVPDAMIVECGSFQRALLERAVQLLCSPEPLAGADQLMQDPSAYLSGKRIGLLCHRSSVIWRDGDAFFLPDELAVWVRDQHDTTKLVAIFSPEHGLEGSHEAAVSVGSEKKSRWGCPVYSLHGAVRKPTSEMLKGLDVIVVDLQDVGLRCFTYVSTLALMLEAAAEKAIPVVVLDRPNPLAMWGAQGPMLTDDNMSFVGKVRVPLLHGQTIGGLAKKLAADCGANVRVIEATSSAIDYFKTYPFLPPSPNIMSYEHLLAYPLTVLIEGTNYSEGRGTQHPFLQVGAPWVDAGKLATALNKQRLAGVYFEPVRFTPRSKTGFAQHPKHEGVSCGGVFVHVYDPSAVKPMHAARVLVATLFRLYPKQSMFIRWGKPYGIDLLAGTKSWRETIQKGEK